MNDGARIDRGSSISLRFELRLQSGEIVDRTEDQDTLDFILGDGTLVEPLERRLLSLSAGAKQTFVVSADESAFGYPQSDMLKEIPRAEFPAQMTLAPGIVVGFDLPNGENVLGTVKSLSADTVAVDFNHPLIGRDFVFKVEVLSVA